jgi:hypothetical protein
MMTTAHSSRYKSVGRGAPGRPIFFFSLISPSLDRRLAHQFGRVLPRRSQRACQGPPETPRIDRASRAQHPRDPGPAWCRWVRVMGPLVTSANRPPSSAGKAARPARRSHRIAGCRPEAVSLLRVHHAARIRHDRDLASRSRRLLQWRPRIQATFRCKAGFCSQRRVSRGSTAINMTVPAASVAPRSNLCADGDCPEAARQP